MSTSRFAVTVAVLGALSFGWILPPRAVALAGAARAVSPAVKAASKCRAAIVKAGSGFVQAEAKTLQKCREGIVKHKLAADTDCRTDGKTAGVLTKARTKLRDAIVKGCGGKDKTCGTADANGSEPPLADIGWNIGQCPNFERGTCTNAIASCADIPTCLQCIDEAAVDQAIGLYYDALVPTDPASKDKAEKARNKCQVTVGKAATKFLVTKSKTLAKCWTGVNKTGGGSCPDTKTAQRIGAAETKAQAAIRKACAGPDKTVGTDDDLARADIGFTASCPVLTVPGGAACRSAVDTLDDVVTCVDCVTEFKSDCASLATVPAFAAYPSECNPPTCTLTLQPTSSSSVQFRNVVWSGTGYTPNGMVDIQQPSGWLAMCRGIVIVPGTTIMADASGNFSMPILATALSFSITGASNVGPAGTVVQVSAADETTGCASPIISYPINVVGPDPSDSLTLLYAPSPVSSALAPPAMPVPGENGSGTVITGECNSNSGGGLTEIRLTLTGAVPDRTLTMFVTPSSSAAVAVGTVTTDDSGNGSFKSYLPHCFPNLGASSTLSLTIDGNAPNGTNEAYRTTLVRNGFTNC